MKLPLRVLVFYGFLLSLVFTSVTLSSYVTYQSSEPKQSQAASLSFVAAGSHHYNMTNQALAFDVSGGQAQSEQVEASSFTVTNEANGKVSQVALNYQVKLVLDTPVPNGAVNFQVVGAGSAGSLQKLNELTYLYTNTMWETPAGQAASLPFSIQVWASGQALQKNFNVAIVSVEVIALQVD